MSEKIQDFKKKAMHLKSSKDFCTDGFTDDLDVMSESVWNLTVFENDLDNSV